MRTIAIANQKGGCGKTTTAINLSACLVSSGKRVLLIDLDPQSHATMGLGVEVDPKKTMYHVMAWDEDAPIVLEDIMVAVKDNFHLAPSDIKLSAIEQELAGRKGREHTLMHALQGLERFYDFIIIDCPPSIGHLCFNALRAAGEAIIPIDMSLFSLRGVAKLTDIMVLLENHCEHHVQTRALVTMFDYRTRYSRQVLEKVKETFKDRVFETVIRYNIRLRETVDHGLPVGDYDKHAIGQKDYENLAREVIAASETGRAKTACERTHAQDILKRAEDYLDAVHDSPIPIEPPDEMDEAFPFPVQSSYSAMIEALAASPAEGASESEDSYEEF
ncbi:MAG: ParA family protein [Deltaproteobacteria bacterium]|nr:ParA family protein [Deltaproteobacteria bacterium]